MLHLLYLFNMECHPYTVNVRPSASSQENHTDLSVLSKVLGTLRTICVKVVQIFLAELRSYVTWVFRYLVHMLTLQELQVSLCFNVYLVISKCITVLILQNLSRHYLNNNSSLDAGILMSLNLRNVLPKYGRFFLKHPIH